MRQFTERQKNLCIGIAIVEAAIALVLIVLRLADVIRLPVFIPLLLLLTAAALFAATRAQVTRGD